mmetsp:Transcript_25008/g.64541  ORF Transcript_25008/g.64541 Transcript_25008/m.64541 type:complete len:353 (+) Transcript_25008:75-1133(+)
MAHDAVDEEGGAEQDEPIPDDAPQPTAVLIRPEDLRTSLGAIWRNLRQAYYVTPCWHAEFYVGLAYSGFISVSQAVPARSGGESIPLLIPEIQRSYGVLHYANLHIERNVAKRAAHYELRFDTAFDDVLAALCEYHENCWLLPEYCSLLRTLHKRGRMPVPSGASGAQFEVHSVELYDTRDGTLVAGEVGYAIGSLFTSLTGFTRAGHPSAGKVQLAGLACVLEHSGSALWNLGHPPREANDRLPASMLYKREIGVTVMPRRAFLRQWIAARDAPLLELTRAVETLRAHCTREGSGAHTPAGVPLGSLLKARRLAQPPKGATAQGARAGLPASPPFEDVAERNQGVHASAPS